MSSLDSTVDQAGNGTLPARPTRMAPIVLAGSIGTVIEWYDFLIYGTAAALVFNSQFFPTLDPLAATLAALTTYAVGFFARPFGGILFGHFGDRNGRKASLMATMVLMTIGTFGIGLLPNYNAIGIWAPIALVVLRVIQGIGLGGEWGGASLMVLEHAPPAQRGFYGSIVQVGFPLGLILSSGAFTVISLVMSDSEFKAWGWRIPFLVSVILLAVGWFVRARIPETPAFSALKQRGEIARSPFWEVMTKDWRAFLIALGLKLSEVSWVYILTVFAVGYGTTKLNMPKAQLLQAVTIAAAIELVTIPLFGWLSDKIGRRPFYFAGVAGTIAMAFPLFWMLETRDPLTVGIAFAVALSVGHGTMFGLQSTYFPELFGARVRYTGASFGFQAAAAIGGGLAPILATSLAAMFGGTAGVSLLLIGLALITLVATICARETLGKALD